MWPMWAMVSWKAYHTMSEFFFFFGRTQRQTSINNNNEKAVDPIFPVNF
jgi:hypothetical protein